MGKPLSHELRGVATALMRGIGTETSMKVLSLIGTSQYDQLVKMTVDPRAYTDPEAYFADALCVNLFRKCVDLPVKDVDPEAEAMKVWNESETNCFKTNMRFAVHNGNGPFEDPYPVRLIECLDKVKNTFRMLIGSVPKQLDDARHGPGATLQDRGKFATLPDKMSSRPTITSGALGFVDLWGTTAWARYLCWEHPNHSSPQIIDTDRLTFADKTALIKRPICVGASINIYYQLGVGRDFRQKLKKNGLDLDHGQDTHVQLARESSKDEKFATVDVRSASDSTAIEAVRFLSTPEWFEVLDSLRSTRTLLPDGSVRVLQKFSAMGNGYTFELETAIFASIAFVAVELSGEVPAFGKNVFVYGDDIIVPTHASALLLTMLDYFGYKPNVGKTFCQGPFRESCGGDFFGGVNVRTHYLKEYPHEPQDWITLANGLRRIGLVSDDGTWGRPWIRNAWFKCLDQLPTNIRNCRGPKELGDILVHDHATLEVVDLDRHQFLFQPPGGGPPRPDTTKPSRHKRVDFFATVGSAPVKRHGVVYYRVYRPVGKPIPLKHWKPGIQLASALYGVPSDGPIPRDQVSGYVFGYAPFS